jgi:hypothetical protein
MIGICQSQQCMRSTMAALFAYFFIVESSAVRAQIDIGSIEAAWRQRQLEAVAFKWIIRKVIAKGAFYHPDGTSSPKKDLVVPEDYLSLYVDGAKIRFESYTPVLSGSRSPTRSTNVFNGVESKNYSEPNAFEYGFGTIFPPDGFQEIKNLNIWPVLLTHRVLPDVGLGFSFAGCTLGGTTTFATSFGDRKCVPLNGAPATPWSRFTFWLDLDRDFTIARMEKRYGDVAMLRSTLDVDYSRDAKWGWVPSMWRLVYLTRDGRIESTADCQVTEYRLGHTIPPDRFEMAFPDGTVVENRATGEKWIQLAVGNKRLITERDIEQQLSYDELIVDDRGRGLWMVFAAGAAPFIILLGWLWWQRRQ